MHWTLFSLFFQPFYLFIFDLKSFNFLTGLVRFKKSVQKILSYNIFNIKLRQIRILSTNFTDSKSYQIVKSCTSHLLPQQSQQFGDLWLNNVQFRKGSIYQLPISSTFIIRKTTEIEPHNHGTKTHKSCRAAKICTC